MSGKVKAWAWCPMCDKGFISQHGVSGHMKVHKKGGQAVATKEKFPQTLNVTIENEGDDEYLDLNGTLEDKAETGKERLVAVYELKEFRVITVNVTSETV